MRRTKTFPGNICCRVNHSSVSAGCTFTAIASDGNGSMHLANRTIFAFALIPFHTTL